MVTEGHPLYTETMASSPPLFIDSLAAFMVVFGRSILAARLAIIAYSMVGFVAVALIAEDLYGWPASLLAPLMLFAIPGIFGMSTRAFSALPASCLIGVALFGELKYIRTGQRGWLVLAGLMTAGGILNKLVVLPAVILPFAAIILWYVRLEKQRKPPLLRLITDNAMAYGFLLLPVLAYLLALGPGVVIDNTIRFHMEGRAFTADELIANAWALVEIFSSQFGMVMLAVIGIVILQSIRPYRNGLLVLSFVSSFAFFLMQSPFRDHHIVILFFPLSIWASVAIADIITRLGRSAELLKYRELTVEVIKLGALVVYLLMLPGNLKADAQEMVKLRTPTESENAAINFLKEATDPDDLVISDEPMLPLLAGRKILPNLTEIAWKRRAVGDLSSRQMIDLAENLRAAAVVLWKNRFDGTPFAYWVSKHYLLAHVDGSDHRVYLRGTGKILDNDVVDGGPRLLGYNYKIGESDSSSSPRIKLTLLWSPPAQSGVIGLHYKILNSVYDIWGEADSVFGWPDNTEGNNPGFIPALVTVPVWLGTPPGEYRISITCPDISEQSAKEIFIGPIDIPAYLNRREMLSVSHFVGAGLADKMVLIGYDISNETPKPGERLDLTLYWEALDQIDANYTVFIHLLGPQGGIVAQQDNQPVRGLYPTDLWEKGTIVRDPYNLTMPADASTGRFTLIVGMYDAVTGRRLEVTSPDHLPETDNIALDSFDIDMES